MTVQPEHTAEDRELMEKILITVEDQILGVVEPPEEGEDIDITFDMATVRGMMQHFSDRMDEWAGVPVPMEGFDLKVEDRYPFKGIENIYRDANDNGREMVTVKVRNSWYSRTKQATVYLLDRPDGGVRLYLRRYSDTGDRLTFWVNTMGAAQVWDLDAEYEARRKLRSMITPHLFAMYEMTGAFFETSPRSNLIYVLRRARPTIALTTFKGSRSGNPISPEDAERLDLGMKILAALCLHPIAYYNGTWAGAMVPTDDVIAHLLMIRGDEHLFWRRANHHPIHSAPAGL